jgi:CRISPR-associated protein Csb1
MADSWLKSLDSQQRVFIEGRLRPRQGDRFQSTGFQGLGPARYQLHDGTEMLLVESAQSVANRLEAACWDDSTGDLIVALKGLPYVKVDLGEYGATSTWQEFHRINSP